MPQREWAFVGGDVLIAPRFPTNLANYPIRLHVFPLQRNDLIPQNGGVLELQPFAGLLHLLLQLGDQLTLLLVGELPLAPLTLVLVHLSDLNELPDRLDDGFG